VLPKIEAVVEGNSASSPAGRSFRVAVGRVLPDRKEAGVVAVSLLQQHVEGPLPSGDDGEARRPVAQDRPRHDLLEDGLAPSDRLPEALGTQDIDRGVLVAVGRHLVPGVRDGADHGGLLFGEPTHDEEGPPGVPFGQEAHETVHDLGGASLEAVPPVGGEVRRQRRGVEVLFHIDGEVVDLLHEAI
jgi:hypothetical protein